MPTNDRAGLLSLADIAMLARVQRPVVSTWRRRAAFTDYPFPLPVLQERGRDFFDAQQIGDWLVATNRGKNAEAASDAADLVRQAAAPYAEPDIFPALSAMLALRRIVGGPLAGSSADEILAIGTTHDPDDEFLSRELTEAGEALEVLASHVDALVDENAGEAAAYENVTSGRLAKDGPSWNTTTLSDTALNLMTQLTLALASAHAQRPVFVDITGSAGDIVRRLIVSLSGRTDVAMVTAGDDGADAREVRRQLTINGIRRHYLDWNETDTFRSTGAALHLHRFPSAAQPLINDVHILNAIDQMVLRMNAHQLVLIMAPASILTEGGLSGEAAQLRAGLLRTGHIRAVVRLPVGLVLQKPQQAQALWVVNTSHPEIALPERLTMVADLTTATLSESVISTLVTDLIAASIGEGALTWASQFSLGRLVRTQSLLGGQRSLVEGLRTSGSVSSPALSQAAARIEQLRALLKAERLSSPELQEWVLQPVSDRGVSVPSATTTIDQLLSAGGLSYLPGGRLTVPEWPVEHDDPTSPPEMVPVIGAAEVFGTSVPGSRFLSRSSLSRVHLASRLTEPGDIVFCCGPTPAARIDPVGGSAVAFPARILRINPRKNMGLLAEMIVADIFAVPPGDRKWRGWVLRQVKPGQLAALSAAIRSLHAEQYRSEERLNRINELVGLLMNGAGAGLLTITPAGAPTSPDRLSPDRLSPEA